MAFLREALAARDTPRGVVLTGEAGVGKTRLATEVASELAESGAVVVMSHGVHLSEGELPYAGISELVRGLVRAFTPGGLTRAAGRDLNALGAFDRRLGDARAPGRTDVTSALLALVEGVARRQPMAWIVDDAQWLDAASRDLLLYLVRVVQDAPLRVIVTVRVSPGEHDEGAEDVLDLVRAPGVASLHVGPLSEEAVAAQALALSEGPLDSTALERIARLSDGLPFFVEELVASRGVAPPTLRRAVTLPTRGLADETRHLLRAAALEDALARPALLARVADLTEAQLSTALSEARARDLVQIDRDRNALRFRHALLRDAVDDEMLDSERRALHLRWADALASPAEEPGAPADIQLSRARHWHESGDRSAAYPHLLAAAEYVDGTQDEAARALWWERVLISRPESENGSGNITRDRVLWNFLMACVGAGAAGRALMVLRQEVRAPVASDRLRDSWLVLTHRHLAKITGDLSDAPPAPADADELFAWLRAVGPDFRANATLHFLLHEWDGERPDLYLPICDELARRGEAEDDVENWYLAMRHRGWWQQSRGDFQGQLDTARAAREVVLTRMPARRLEAEWDWCWGLEEAGRYAEAVKATTEAIEQIDEPRAVLHLWSIIVACLGAACSALGDWDKARATLAQVDEHLDSTASPMMDALIAGLDGEIAARRGDFDRARRRLGPASLREADTSTPGQALTRLALAAEIALVTGDRVLADQTLAQMAALPHAVGAPDEVAQALLSLARSADTHDDRVLDRVLTLADRFLPPGGAVPAAVRAELAEHPRRTNGTDTPAGWAGVVDAWLALKRPYDVAWCRYLHAQAALREDDRQQATTALVDAWRIAGRLGAEPLSARVVAVARRARLRLEGLALDTVADLTERETQVLRLLARGLTNAQIADELVMSPKTASVHVSRVLTKLGVTNRTEAAAYAHLHGLGPSGQPGR